MVVKMHFVFLVTIANYFICQAAEVSTNETQNNNISLLVTVTTTTSTRDNASPSTKENTSPSIRDNTSPSTKDNTSPSTKDNTSPSTNDNTTRTTNDNITLIEEEELSSLSDNDTIPWDNFIKTLTYVSLEQLKQTKSNIKTHYNFKKIHKKDVDKVFNNSDTEYEYLLQYRLKQIIDEKNETDEFMLDVLDLSNFVVEKIIEYNLDKLENQYLLTPTNWYRQNLKHKILRQQVKISTAIIEMQICNMLALCKEREYYSEYVIEWLRCLLSKNDVFVKDFFKAVPVIVDKNSGFMKSNTLFRKNMQYAANKDANAQRAVLDFMDETITNENVFTLIPDELKKCAVLFIRLINAINDVYELHDRDNYEELENISQMLMSRKGDAAEIKEILDAIIKNMQTNFKSWPNKKQAKINKIWTDITLL